MSIKTSDAAKVFKSLSDPNRLAIVLALVDGEKNAKDLLEGMNFLQPTLSHHLSLLCESETLIARRDGKNVFYRINTKTAKDVAEVLEALTSASSEKASSQKAVAVKTVKSRPVREKAEVNAEQKSEPKVEPQETEEPQIRRSQVFDFFD